MPAAGAAGSRRVQPLPRPRSLVAVTVPPCAVARPSPSPDHHSPVRCPHRPPSSPTAVLTRPVSSPVRRVTGPCAASLVPVSVPARGGLDSHAWPSGACGARVVPCVVGPRSRDSDRTAGDSSPVTRKRPVPGTPGAGRRSRHTGTTAPGLHTDSTATKCATPAVAPHRSLAAPRTEHPHHPARARHPPPDPSRTSALDGHRPRDVGATVPETLASPVPGTARNPSLTGRHHRRVTQRTSVPVGIRATVRRRAVSQPLDPPSRPPRRGGDGTGRRRRRRGAVCRPVPPRWRDAPCAASPTARKRDLRREGGAGPSRVVPGGGGTADALPPRPYFFGGTVGIPRNGSRSAPNASAGTTGLRGSTGVRRR